MQDDGSHHDKVEVDGACVNRVIEDGIGALEAAESVFNSDACLREIIVERSLPHLIGADHARFVGGRQPRESSRVPGIAKDELLSIEEPLWLHVDWALTQDSGIVHCASHTCYNTVKALVHADNSLHLHAVVVVAAAVPCPLVYSGAYSGLQFMHLKPFKIYIYL